MRLMNLSVLKPGEKLSYAIKTENGGVLLPANAVLTHNFIQRLRSFGINAVYINDDIFDEVCLKPSLTEQTKTEALKAVESAYSTFDTKKPVDASQVKLAARNIVSDVKQISSDTPIGLFDIYAVKDNRCLHAVNVATIVSALAFELGRDAGVAEDYTQAALLHDIFLNNMSEDKNYDHADTAREFLKLRMEYSVRMYMSVGMHHERFDGKGPGKFAGDKIAEGARLIAVADVYDSLLNGYGEYKALASNYALEQMHTLSGKVLDPDIVRCFNSAVAIYPIGATVKLNNGYEAVVVGQNNRMPARPKVRLNMPDKVDCIEINLLTNLTTFIEKIV